MKKAIFVALILLISLSLIAEEISIKKAMFLSALIPGMGEMYTRNYTKGSIFLGTELAILFAHYRLKAETEWAINNYEQFAYINAGVPKSSDDYYYQLIQDNYSSESYNNAVEQMARNYFLIINNDKNGDEEYLENNLIPEDMSWDWENNRNWNRYIELRQDKQNLEIISNFTVAAAIINRIVSVIDAARSAKKFNLKIKENYYGKLTVEPDIFKKGMKIKYEYKF